ncbi:hypothetical protein KI387_036902, partial [Taxus chinensis]
PRKALEVALCTEAIGSVDTGISPFLEAQITAMAKQLEKIVCETQPMRLAV